METHVANTRPPAVLLTRSVSFGRRPPIVRPPEWTTTGTWDGGRDRQPPAAGSESRRGGRRARTVYIGTGGGGGGGVVIGNDTAGPTSTSSLLQTPLQPPRPTPPLVGQPNATAGGVPVAVDGVGVGLGIVVGGGGGESGFDGGYWWWALLAVFLVLATAAGNILVCLAITWERRLQNVTNYFLMSLAVTDLMVAVLVMPIGILTLVKGTRKIITSILYLNKM